MARLYPDPFALIEVAQRGFQRCGLCPEETAPIVLAAEVPDAGQELVVDVELEPAFFVTDAILAVRLVLIAVDRIRECRGHAFGHVPERVVVPIDEDSTGLAREAFRAEHIARLVGLADLSLLLRWRIIGLSLPSDGGSSGGSSLRWTMSRTSARSSTS